MSIKGHPPAFMIYPADFSSDGVVEAMTTQEVGAYWLLLCKAWFESPVGTIPDDDFILARWTRLTQKQWLAAKRMVLKAFTPTANGRLIQKRMAIEYEKLMAERDRRSHAGAKGADKRWHGTTIAEPCVSHASAIGLPMANDSFPFPSSFPSSITEIQIPPIAPQGGEVQGIDSGEVTRKKKPAERTAAFERWYAVYPKRVGPDAAARAFTTAMRKIESRHPSRDAALDWLIQVTGEYAVSAQACEFGWNPATFLNQGHYDDDQSQWNRNGAANAFGNAGGNRGSLEHNRVRNDSLLDQVDRERQRAAGAGGSATGGQGEVPSSGPGDGQAGF